MRERAKNKEKHNNDNNVIIQITLFDVNGRYKPISTLIEVENVEYYKQHSKECKEKAFQKICNQRLLTGKELIKLGYTKVKVRNYTLWKQIQEGKKERRKEA